MRSFEELYGARIYLDSNVFIYALEGTDNPRHRATTQLLRESYAQRCTVATSVIARAEVLVQPLRLQQVELADRYRDLLSGAGVVTLYPLGVPTIDYAAELRADYPTLKLPDALHIATAMHAGCDAFLTGDRALTAVSARIAVLHVDQLPEA